MEWEKNSSCVKNGKEENYLLLLKWFRLKDKDKNKVLSDVFVLACLENLFN